MSQFISYAQNFEDVMLWRALKDVEHGFYIDLGAWSPDLDSVTKAFYDRGWRGINVEPNPEFCEQLREKRPRDVNLQVAVSNRGGRKKIRLLDNSGLSTLDEEIAERHEANGWESSELAVAVMTLAGIWKKNVTQRQDVHFLKIDVEGAEKDIVTSTDWAIFRPWVIVIESTLPMSQIEAHSGWESHLISADYLFVYADGLNRFYLAAEHSDRRSSFKYPPNVFDDFIRSDLFFKARELESSKSQHAEVMKSMQEEQARLLGEVSMASEIQVQIKEAEARYLKESNRGDRLESRLEQAETRAAKEAERAERTESRLEQAETRAAKEAERADRTELRLEQAEKRAAKDAERADRTELRLEQAEERAAKEAERADRAESRLEQAEKRAAKEAERAEVRLDEFETDARDALEKAEHLLLRVQGLEKKQAQTQSAADMENARARDLEAQLAEIKVRHEEENCYLHAERNETQARLNESLSNAHHWWIAATEKEETIDALRSSWSWRVTWPVRKAVVLIRWLLLLPVRFFRWVLKPIVQRLPFISWALFRSDPRVDLPVTAAPKNDIPMPAQPAAGAGEPAAENYDANVRDRLQPALISSAATEAKSKLDSIPSLGASCLRHSKNTDAVVNENPAISRLRKKLGLTK